MKKVSIVWFSKSKNTYNRISLSTFKTYLLISLHIMIYLSVVFLGGLSIYQQYKIYKSNKQIISLNQRIIQLDSNVQEGQKQISQLKANIKSKTKKISTLEKKLLATQNELKDMKEMEVKIKKFLGLQDQEVVSGKFSHQGGFGYSNSTQLEQDLSSQDSENTSNKNKADIVSYSKDLKETMEQLVDYLEKRHKKLKHMPSILPVKGDHFWISCGFGWRINPFTQQREFHGAIDIAGEWKTPIVAPADGVVIKVGKNSILGNYVRIRHTPHIVTLYGHLYKAIVKKGDRVKRWDVIGYMGNTGRSTGTHVHYKVEVDGKPVNPKYYIYDRRLKSLALR
ncbi:hypothetical protein JCM13304A_23560 [Desulfothermus okinawensis JCM 13304]